MDLEIHEPVVAYNRPNSIQEFLDYVEPLQAKYEWLDGELLMMAGSTLGHAIVRDNVSDYFKEKLRKRGCLSFQESVYLRVKNKDKTLFLPDVQVACDPDNYDLKSRFIENPTIIVEILSESTELFDRGEKWAHYRKIPSLRYYIMVSQQQPLVEVYARANAQSLFYYETFEGLDASVELRYLELSIPMPEIYEGIVFDAAPQPPEFP